MSVKNRSFLTKVPTTDEWKELHQKAKKQAIVGMIFYAIRNPKPFSLMLIRIVTTESLKTSHSI